STCPIARALREPFSVVQFDAHLDSARFVRGLEFTNGHAFRHIAHLPNVRSLTQVGIRGLRNTQTMMEDSLGDGNRVVTMDEFRDVAGRGIVEAIPKNDRCYVSIDIDALDLSLVPGCVSAEPDGMSYRMLRDVLFGLAEHTEI